MRVIHTFGTTEAVLLEIFFRGTTLLDKWVVRAVLVILDCFKPHPMSIGRIPSRLEYETWQSGNVLVDSGNPKHGPFCTLDA